MSFKFDICIYHADCIDGFTAAWVIQQRYLGIKCYPCQYGQPFPDIDVEGKAIIIADFSFPPDVLAPIAEKAEAILILDHHKTARDMLEGLPRISRPQWDLIPEEFASQVVTGDGSWRDRILVEFDMDRSGASMAWDFCRGHKDNPKPAIIEIVEDRDLWRFRLPYTREVIADMQSWNREFHEWDAGAKYLQTNLNDSIMTGAAILRWQRTLVDQIVDGARREFFFGHEDVPVCHCPYALASDSCHALLEKYPDAPFAVAAVYAHGGISFSLRSSDDRLDVSTVAKQHGGGGHSNAAGFRVELELD